MSAERKKVLEMLAEGKITTEEAERLLDKIFAARPADRQEKTDGVSASEPKKQRYLRIVLQRPGEDLLNVRIPLAFTRSGARLLAVLPPRVSERLREHGIDLAAFTSLKNGELAQAIEDMNVQIERGSGKKVSIFCE